MAVAVVLSAGLAFAPPSTGVKKAPQSAVSTDSPTRLYSGADRTCAVSSKLVPECGTWFGAAPLAKVAVSRTEAVNNLQQRAQTHLDLLHVYHTDDDLFPTAEERSLSLDPQRPRYLMINYKPSTSLSWAQVAAGAVDDRLIRLSTSLREYPKRFFLTIYHEPEDNVRPEAGSGFTADDYRRMYRHTEDVLRAHGVDNAVFVMNYMGFFKWGLQPWFGDLYPGTSYVDWVAYDPYIQAAPGWSWGEGRPQDLLNRPEVGWPGMYSWLSLNYPTKPIMVAEWGVAEYFPDCSRKVAFYNRMTNQFADYPRIKAMLIFDTPVDDFGNLDATSCSSDTSVETSKTALRRFAAMDRFSAMPR